MRSARGKRGVPSKPPLSIPSSAKTLPAPGTYFEVPMRRIIDDMQDSATWSVPSSHNLVQLGRRWGEWLLTCNSWLGAPGGGPAGLSDIYITRGRQPDKKTPAMLRPLRQKEGLVSVIYTLLGCVRLQIMENRARTVPPLNKNSRVILLYIVNA
jgi:hypothetical protein